MLFKQLAKDSAIYGGADFISKIVSFFTFPFIARALSPEAFGYLELILTGTALLGVVGNFGLNNAVQRFYWDGEVHLSERKMMVSTGLFIQLAVFSALSIIALVIGILFFPALGTAYAFTWWGIIAALLLMAGNQWTQYLLDVLRLHFKPWSFLTISFISRLMSAGLGVVAVVWLGKGIDGLLGSQAVIVLLVLPLAIFMVRKDLSITYYSKSWARELLKFGYPFIFSALAFWIFSAQDRWMLASLSSVEEVGIYSVSFRFASVILFVSAAFGQAWSPIALKIKTDHPNSYPKIYGDVLILLLVVMVSFAAFLGLFSGEIILLIMGDKYLNSALPMLLLSFSVVFQASQQVTGIGISLEKKTILFAYLTWGATGINFGLNWLLISQLGALGASLATLISYFVLSGGYFYFTQRLHPLKINYVKFISLLSITFFLIFLAFWFYRSEIEAEIIVLKVGFLVLFVVFSFVIIPFKSIENV